MDESYKVRYVKIYNKTPFVDVVGGDAGNPFYCSRFISIKEQRLKKLKKLNDQRKS